MHCLILRLHWHIELCQWGTSLPPVRQNCSCKHIQNGAVPSQGIRSRARLDLFFFKSVLASLALAQNQFVCNVNVIPCSWSRELSVLLLLIVAWLKDETITFRSQRGKRKAAGKRDELGNTVGTRLQCEIIITVQIPTRVWPLSAKFRPKCGLGCLPNSLS